MTSQSHPPTLIPAERTSWNEYFMTIAANVATRSTCLRKKVGAIIIDPQYKTILATGYNGSLPSAPHCVDVGCHVVNNHCTTTIHAETNAINQAAKTGVQIANATIYCTCKPCWSCFKNIIQAGITNIYYDEDYVDSSQSLYQQYLKSNPNIIMRKL